MKSEGIAANALAGTRQPQTVAEMDRMRASIANLSRQADALIERLQPVLFDSLNKNCTDECAAPAPTLAEHPSAIRRQRREIDEVARKLTSALSQLEI